MRILQLIDRMDDGGAQRVVASLSLALQGGGDEVSIVCLRDLGRMPVAREEFERSGVDLIELHKADGFSPRTMARLIRYARNRGVDVIHTHNPLVLHYGALARLGARSPALVQTVHGINTLRMASWSFRLYQASLRATDKVVSVCGAVNTAVLRDVGVTPARACIIDNGIDMDELLSIEPKAGEGPFVFGIMGRLVAVKDHQNLLAAMKILRSKGVSCRLLILGSGELEADLKKTVTAMALSETVSFLGWSRDIRGFLSRIDALVLCSVSEGLPLAVVEAMAAGKPVVATQVGGVPELLGEGQCGWLCPPAQPSALAEAMLLATDRVASASKGAEGRHRAVARYSASRMAAQYRELFRELTVGRRNQRATRPDFEPSVGDHAERR